MSGGSADPVDEHAPSPTAGGALLEHLHRLGIEWVFANSGTDFPPIVEGLAEARANGRRVPEVLVVGHEHVAMGMAYGAFVASDHPQAVILHTNVGLANGAIGAINAATDRVPILMMSGRTPVVERDRFGARTVPIGWGQEMRDQAALIREACKWEYELRYAEQLPTLLERATAIADSTPRGPVYLSLPREVLCETADAVPTERPPAIRRVRIEPDEPGIGRIADLIATAHRPLIIAQRGAGTEEGFAALAELSDRQAIPICQYWAVATAVAADHPMYVGQDPEPWISEADLVVVVDSLAPWSPEVHRPPADCRVVQLGPDPLDQRFPVRDFPTDDAVTGEVGPSLVGLCDALRSRAPDEGVVAERRARVAEHNDRRAAALEAIDTDAGEHVTKAWVARRLGEVIGGRRATVLSELGCPLDPLGLRDHGAWRQEPHSGGLGWSLPCGLGMKLADPDRLVVATMGDGSYTFANPVACHQAAEAHGIAVLTIVLDNGGYGAVRDSVLGLYPTGYASKLDHVPLTSLRPSPDFAAVARASRAHAEHVTRRADLPEALDRAIEVVTGERRQALLHVEVVG